MNRSLVLSLALIVSLWSCGAQQSSQTNSASPAVSVESGGASQEPKAFNILHDIALWKEEGGSLKWMKSLAIGDEVRIFNDVRKFKTEGSQTERSYVKVGYGGSEGWVRDDFIIPDSRLGVVMSPAAKIFTEPKDIKVSAKTLGNMTLVAIRNGTETNGYVKVAGYDYSQDALFSGDTWVSLSDLTTREDDITLTTLYTAAQVTKSPEQKKNLLSTAVEKYSGSFFAPKAQDALNLLLPPQETPPATVEAPVEAAPSETSGE